MKINLNKNDKNDCAVKDRKIKLCVLRETRFVLLMKIRHAQMKDHNGFSLSIFIPYISKIKIFSPQSFGIVL